MTKFRKKPVVIEATQWFKNGDHPQDYSLTHDGFENGELRQFSPEERKAKGWEGDVVRYYRNPDDSGERRCEHCGNIMHEHGWIDTLEGGHIVCPGDWIIPGVKGEHYPCKPDVFAKTYEPETTPSKDIRTLVHETVQDVQEWDDRTSPENYLLITPDELTKILLNFSGEIQRTSPAEILLSMFGPELLHKVADQLEADGWAIVNGAEELAKLLRKTALDDVEKGIDDSLRMVYE